MRVVDVAVAFLLANNLLFFHFLGLNEVFSPSLRGTWLKRLLLLGTVFVLTALVFWLIEHYFLIPTKLQILDTLVCAVALLGASLVVAPWAKSLSEAGSPPFFKEVLLNSFLFGGCLLVVKDSETWVDLILVSFFAVIGYAFSLVLLRAVSSRLARENIPSVVQGLPLQLFTCGLICLFFSGLSFSFSGAGR